jgi:tRNA A-37 threonylcarbamoyl transferase component Bud32
VVVIAQHRHALEKLGLSTLEQIRRFHGQVLKDHKGRRDVFRITANNDDGFDRVLFLKRSWKPYRKDGLASLLRRREVWSVSRTEWENSKALQNAGFRTAALVAFGEECGPLWERFSFIITEAASGEQTVEQFLRTCGERALRRRVFESLARFVQRMHDTGLATPDLFTRHVFVDLHSEPPQFCLIDMARLDQRATIPRRLRARDLAALNLSAPLRFVTARERVRFLHTYAGRTDRTLFELIRRRTNRLLPRGRFKDFEARGGRHPACQ